MRYFRSMDFLFLFLFLFIFVLFVLSECVVLIILVDVCDVAHELYICSDKYRTQHENTTKAKLQDEKVEVQTRHCSLIHKKLSSRKHFKSLNLHQGLILQCYSGTQDQNQSHR